MNVSLKLEIIQTLRDAESCLNEEHLGQYKVGTKIRATLKKLGFEE
jgi:hypothetical protein